MVWILFVSLLTLRQSYTPQRMVGMNLCGFFPCTITSTCDISKDTMTGLSHLACAPPKITLSRVLLIGLFCCGINGLRNVRVFCVFKEGLLQHMMIKGWSLQLLLEDTLECLMLASMIRLKIMYKNGPLDIFSVGVDVSDANVVKFSNDGRLMLLTTMDGHIHVLDSFRGTLLSTYNVKPVSSNCTLEASFSPEGMFVISGSGDGSVYAWSVRSGKEVASWMSSESEPPVIKWASGNLMFVTGSSELSFWIPDLSKLGAYVGRK